MLFVKRDSSPLWSGGHKEDSGGMGIDGMNLKLHALLKIHALHALEGIEARKRIILTKAAASIGAT